MTEPQPIRMSLGARLRPWYVLKAEQIERNLRHDDIVFRYGVDLRYGKCNATGHYACRLPLPDTTMYAHINTLGRVMVAEYCDECGQKRSNWLSHKALREQGIDIEALPIASDRTRSEWSPCERCGRTDLPIELHHWAPQSLFDDPNDWPMSDLCIDCHREWHHTTRCGLAHGGPR